MNLIKLAKQSVLLTAVMLSSPSALYAQDSFDVFDETQKAGNVVSFEAKPNDWLVNAASDWMAKLPDNTQLKDISIPGTHDSGARFGLSACKNQTWTIASQLEGGIRYFDIRNRRTQNGFSIHHGPCFQKMTFGNVLDDIKAFLENHPNEVVLMRVKEEFMAEQDSDSFYEIWERYMQQYSHLFVPDMERLPTLGEARGKIVVLRNAGFAGYGQPLFGNPDITMQDAFKVFWLLNDNPFGKGTVSLAQKVRLINLFIDDAEHNNVLTMNHVSGAVGMMPRDVARVTNASTYERIVATPEQNKLGVLIMDFPGERLIYRIIKANFVK